MDLFMGVSVMQIFAESETDKIPVGVSNNPLCSQKQFSYGSFLILEFGWLRSQPNLAEFRTKKENKHSSALNATISREAIHSSFSMSLL